MEAGKLADLVLWEPKFFGIKPEVVFKGGFPAWSVMGESNASLMTCEPRGMQSAWIDSVRLLVCCTPSP